MRKSTLGKFEAAPRLGVLIHEAVRQAIERAVDEELAAALGAQLYARTDERRGYRNGSRSRSMTGPTGKFEMIVPRATMFTNDGGEEWRSKLLPRYSRRIAEVNEAVTAAYLGGANTRRIRGALSPLRIPDGPDHPFRLDPITRFGQTRSPIPVDSIARFGGPDR